MVEAHDEGLIGYFSCRLSKREASAVPSPMLLYAPWNYIEQDYSIRLTILLPCAWGGTVVVTPYILSFAHTKLAQQRLIPPEQPTPDNQRSGSEAKSHHVLGSTIDAGGDFQCLHRRVTLAASRDLAHSGRKREEDSALHVGRESAHAQHGWNKRGNAKDGNVRQHPAQQEELRCEEVTCRRRLAMDCDLTVFCRRSPCSSSRANIEM